MIYIPVSQLEAGMVLAGPVLHPGANAHVLLRANHELNVAEVKALSEYEIRGGWIHHPGFEFLDDKMGTEIPRARVRLYEGVKQSFTGIAKRTAGAFDLREYQAVVGNMILSLVANKKTATWAERIMDGDDELFAHSANVAYLSLVIGMQIRDYIVSQRLYVNLRDGRDLTNLGIGAMLHDLGKLGLENRYQSVHFCDPAADSDEYRSHAQRGYDAVRGRVEATASQVLLHHHQRFDGKGFPKRRQRLNGSPAGPLKGEKIHIFSRIVAVANAIDGLMSAQPKEEAPLFAAMATIQNKPFRSMFDSVVLKAAVRVIPPFPLGMVVQLSDSRRAVVTGLNESKPDKPTVGLLAGDQNESEGNLETLDLSLPGTPAIVPYGNSTAEPAHALA